MKHYNQNKQNKTERLTIRMTKEQLKIISDFASKSGYSKGAYLVRCGLRQQIEARLSEQELAVYFQITKMGANLNTLIKLSHSQNMFPLLLEFVALRDKLSNLLQKLK